MIAYDGQMATHDYDIELWRNHHDKTKNKRYCNDIFCLDIETTSVFYDGDKIIEYEKGLDAEYWNSLEPIALPYIAMFSVNDIVYYVREFKDILKIFDDMPNDIQIIIWVHNLSFEFQFLLNILTWKDVFARSPHKVMKCTPTEYPNIEFRCTYFLTRLSLESWGKQIGTHKKTGDLDYTITRTPLTPLTDAELGYCEMDCLVMYEGIKQYRERYGNLRNIPLTQTGTVRRVVKEKLTRNEDYMRHVKKLVPHNANEYKMLQTLFAGGYTHANRIWAGRTIKGKIRHRDFASSYPYVMLTRKYPDTPWTFVFNPKMPDRKDFEDTAYIFKMRFKNIQCVTYNTYIQASKIIGKNVKYDNGRVICADELEMLLTDVDYTIVEDCYKWDEMQIEFMYKSTKHYLPRELLGYILELYDNKTKLKNVEGKEDLYLQSKQYINSLFGMMVTAIVQSSVYLLDDGEWDVPLLTADYVDDYLNNLRGGGFKYKNKYFLSFSYGVYVTAYARRNLWDCILYGDNDYYTIYCDTDSIFTLSDDNYDWYNKRVINETWRACRDNKLDIAKTRPCTPDGKIKKIGMFESEDDCTEFKTLGAKRYVERRATDGKLHLTVSGINKGAVELLNDGIDNFSDGFNFDKDADCVHKMLLTYCNNMSDVTFPDGYTSHYRYGINMRNNGYVLTMTDEYKRVIDMLSAPPQNFKVSMRGRFLIN